MIRKERRKPLTLENVCKQFIMQEHRAAKKLNVSVTTLKKFARRNGIERWPFRKVREFERKIERAKKEIKALSKDKNCQRILKDKEKRLKMLEKMLLDLKDPSNYGVDGKNRLIEQRSKRKRKKRLKENLGRKNGGGRKRIHRRTSRRIERKNIRSYAEKETNTQITRGIPVSDILNDRTNEHFGGYSSPTFYTQPNLGTYTQPLPSPQPPTPSVVQNEVGDFYPSHHQQSHPPLFYCYNYIPQVNSPATATPVITTNEKKVSESEKVYSFPKILEHAPSTMKRTVLPSFFDLKESLLKDKKSNL